jgi:hypothetical protein
MRHLNQLLICVAVLISSCTENHEKIRFEVSTSKPVSAISIGLEDGKGENHKSITLNNQSNWVFESDLVYDGKEPMRRVRLGVEARLNGPKNMDTFSLSIKIFRDQKLIGEKKVESYYASFGGQTASALLNPYITPNDVKY